MRPPVPRPAGLTGNLAPAAVAPAVAVLAAVALAGCGPPPELRERPTDPPVPPPVATSPGTIPPVPTSPGTDPGRPSTDPTPTGASPAAGREYAEEVAVPCDGHPDDGTIVAVLREEDILARPLADRVEVTAGPLCAGDWQYAVVLVPDHDPLQVVTRGDPAAPTLVTAGTDVCTGEVRRQAPPGIRTAADCVG